MSQPLQWQGSDLILSVRIQPRASKDEIVGMHGEFIKIRITAPPVEGKANTHLIHYFSKLFDVPKSQIELIGGDNAREKRFRIKAPRSIPAQLTQYLPSQKM